MTLEIRFYYAGNGAIPPVPIQFGNVRIQGGSGCTEGEYQGEHVCDDGSTIYDQVCQGGVWVPTGDVCSAPPPVCRDQHLQQQCIGDFVWDCVNNQWVNTGIDCGGGQQQGSSLIPIALIGAAIVGTVAFLLFHK